LTINNSVLTFDRLNTNMTELFKCCYKILCIIIGLDKTTENIQRKISKLVLEVAIEDFDK